MAQAFAILLEATKGPNGSLTYADVIGSTYMDVFPYRRKGQFKDTRAQFFTPWVAECMAKMSLMDAEAICIERLKKAVEGDPTAEALALMTTAFPEEAERFFFERLLPTRWTRDRARHGCGHLLWQRRHASGRSQAIPPLGH